ncbi:hypothetical protein [Burkholderia cenocepacia]|uniref:hypothetical protein n=1 Tax=Burkholderia cenocepacia TaxID=95486 RepID=UPI002B240FC4|nr:hypothetical protein [Burkholderia cenocepacia]MEB2554065.1 hypothetical protein [Burkholderia cenocepacia]
MASKQQSGGIGMGGILFILFLALKLTGFIDWSWWWVTAPLWIPAAIFFSFAALVCIMAAFAGLTSK